MDKFLIPLQYWFNKNPGLALPIINLSYRKVNIKLPFIETESMENEIDGNKFDLDSLCIEIEI